METIPLNKVKPKFRRPKLITARDLKCIAFVEAFRIAKCSTLATLFYGGNKVIARRRLTVLVNAKHLKRAQFDTHCEYLYYYKTPDHLNHHLKVSDFIARLSTEVNLIDYEPHFVCGNVVSDARVKYEKGGEVKNALIEVQLTDAPNLEKYTELKRTSEWSKYFPVFPKLLIVCDAHFASLGLDVVRYRTDFTKKL